LWHKSSNSDKKALKRALSRTAWWKQAGYRHNLVKNSRNAIFGICFLNTHKTGPGRQLKGSRTVARDARDVPRSSQGPLPRRSATSPRCARSRGKVVLQKLKDRGCVFEHVGKFREFFFALQGNFSFPALKYAPM